jgi:RimJ/RimL family protein N-acetyltransferase
MSPENQEGQQSDRSTTSPEVSSSESLTEAAVDLHAVDALQQIEVRDSVMLRPLTIEDAPNMLSVIESDPTIRERVSVAAKFRSEADVALEIDRIAHDPQTIRYTILLGGIVVGLVSFWKDPGYFGQTPESDGYGFGYFLDPAYRGEGIITDSMKAIMKIALNNLRVQSFVAFTEDNNQESRALLQKLGFEPTDEVYGEPDNGWPERKHKLSIK